MSDDSTTKANLELSYYMEQHQPVTRQVVIAILDIEETAR